MNASWHCLRFFSLLVVSAPIAGCCQPLLISQRYHDAPLPTCAAEEGEPTSAGVAIPSVVVPTIPWPTWCHRRYLFARARAWGHERYAEVGDMLQPGPAPPLKPPHSRFHPVPTQPVFAARAEYAPPERIETDPAKAAAAKTAEGQFPEEIPTPAVDESASPVPRAQERTWRDLPPPGPRSPAIPEPPAAEPPAPNPAIVPPPPSPDASRGPLGLKPATSREKNPLR